MIEFYNLHDDELNRAMIWIEKPRCWWYPNKPHIELVRTGLPINYLKDWSLTGPIMDRQKITPEYEYGINKEQLSCCTYIGNKHFSSGRQPTLLRAICITHLIKETQRKKQKKILQSLINDYNLRLPNTINVLPKHPFSDLNIELKSLHQ